MNTLQVTPSAAPEILEEQLGNLPHLQLRRLFVAVARILRVPEPETQTAPSVQNQPHPFEGKYVICRCYGAGVHAGWFVAQKGTEVFLRDSRRLFDWSGPGVALSGVAQGGLKSGLRIDVVNPELQLHDVIETIPCTVKATESISKYVSA
jgi:hypothetical protein